jgi:hypothetical protein
VVDHEIQDHPDAAAVGLAAQGGEVLVGAVLRVDALVVGGVVPVVARRDEDRHQPQRVHTEVGRGVGVAVVEVVELGGQTPEVTDPVPVGILEAAHEGLVEHRGP